MTGLTGPGSIRTARLGYRRSLARLRQVRQDEGYIAVVVALCLMLIIGLCGFSIDVGNWYRIALQAQKAADAAALAGVVNLPGAQNTAFSTAQTFSTLNGFKNGVGGTTVTPAIGQTPTQLKVNIDQTVNNFFGPLLGVPTTTITRTATADFVAPLTMGSPCNEYGSDPYNVTTAGLATANGNRSTNCDGSGNFFAVAAGQNNLKGNGDAYLAKSCPSGGVDNCTSPANNTDYDPNGYFYQVTTSRDIANLSFQVFDPVTVSSGQTCANSVGTGIYAPGIGSNPSTNYCTGDYIYSGSLSGSNTLNTTFTVRAFTAASNSWDPLSYPVQCTQTYGTYAVPNPAPTTGQTLFPLYRKWVPVCTIASAPAGTYFFQITTSGTLDAQNHFSLAAWSTSDSTAKNAISVSGYKKMALYAGVSATTNFFMARVPNAAAGHILDINLFDIGDVSSGYASLAVLQPTATGTTAASNCVGVGPKAGTMANCTFNTSTGVFNGKWQLIQVPIPTTYNCGDDTVATNCWYRLQYTSSGGQPTDTTSWAAGLEGDPVRLVK